MNFKKCDKCGLIKAGTEKWYHFFKWDLCWGHDRRVSELEFLKNISSDDVLLCVDTSEHMTKQVKVGDLVEYIKTQS